MTPSGKPDLKWFAMQDHLHCDDKWNPLSVKCCSIDTNYIIDKVHKNDHVAQPRDQNKILYHNSIVRHIRNETSQPSLFYVWNNIRHRLRYPEMARQMGFTDDTIIDVSSAELSRIPKGDGHQAL